MFKADANSFWEVIPVASKTLCKKDSNLVFVILFTRLIDLMIDVYINKHKFILIATLFFNLIKIIELRKNEHLREGVSQSVSQDRIF